MLLLPGFMSNVALPDAVSRASGRATLLIKTHPTTATWPYLLLLDPLRRARRADINARHLHSQLSGLAVGSNGKFQVGGHEARDHPKLRREPPATASPGIAPASDLSRHPQNPEVIQWQADPERRAARGPSTGSAAAATLPRTGSRPHPATSRPQNWTRIGHRPGKHVRIPGSSRSRDHGAHPAPRRPSLMLLPQPHNSNVTFPDAVTARFL